MARRALARLVLLEEPYQAAVSLHGLPGTGGSENFVEDAVNTPAEPRLDWSARARGRYRRRSRCGSGALRGPKPVGGASRRDYFRKGQGAVAA